MTLNQTLHPMLMNLEQFARSGARGSVALFSGPSGTGKTMAAEVIASRLNKPLIKVNLKTIVSRFIGETEKNLDRVFNSANRPGTVLLFDEADALFGRRTNVKDAHDRYANVETNYLLKRAESHAGLVILATNNKQNIDPALLRRIRHTLQFPLP